MKKNAGLTLVEIMIVLIIVGIIAAFAVPSFVRTLEGSRMNEARVNLGIIAMGQRVYRANNPAVGFWGPGATTVNDINNTLSVDIIAQNYNNGINVTATGGPNPTTGFTATLARTAGSAVDWSFTINQANVITCAGTNCPCGTGGMPAC